MTDVFLLISNSCDHWFSYILITYFPSTITAMWHWQWELPISKSEAQSLLAFLAWTSFRKTQHDKYTITLKSRFSSYVTFWKKVGVTHISSVWSTKPARNGAAYFRGKRSRQPSDIQIRRKSVTLNATFEIQNILMSVPFEWNILAQMH